MAKRRTGDGGISVEPLTITRWPDLESIFEARGCSVARGCWCMYYRRSGEAPAPAEGQTRAQANKAGFKALVASGAMTGVIGYRHGAPVGWLSFGPREDFAKLVRSPVMKAVDAQPVWSVICFVVPAAHRGQGVARGLLDGAIAHARRRGITLEAYPVDKAERSDDEHLWFGAKSMFDAAGFEEVARRKPTRTASRAAQAGVSRIRFIRGHAPSAPRHARGIARHAGVTARHAPGTARHARGTAHHARAISDDARPASLDAEGIRADAPGASRE